MTRSRIKARSIRGSKRDAMGVWKKWRTKKERQAAKRLLDYPVTPSRIHKSKVYFRKGMQGRYWKLVTEEDIRVGQRK